MHLNSDFFGSLCRFATGSVFKTGHIVVRYTYREPQAQVPVHSAPAEAFKLWAGASVLSLVLHWGQLLMLLGVYGAVKYVGVSCVRAGRRGYGSSW